MKLVVWPDLSSKVVTDADVRDLLRTYPKLTVLDCDEPWSGKHLATEPEKPREPTAFGNSRAPERYRTWTRDAQKETPAG